jgi:diketogulonate reductase-like aldo/keto reductase
MITELCGKRIFPVGIGTWHMGGDAVRAIYDNDKNEINALKFAVKNGINVIDTAEMYGRGHAEELVAEAIKTHDREKLFIISKVHPLHLTYDKVIAAAKSSLARLKTKYIDMYLIHWPIPGMDLEGTIKGMEELIDAGLIRSMGVSNFGVEDVKRAMAATKKYDIAANQIHYSLMKKEDEEYLIPFCNKNKVKIIAYTPLGKGSVLKMREVVEMAEKYKKKPSQIALNYLMKKSLPIPKASNTEHIKEFIGSVGWSLSEDDYEKLAQTR